MLDKEILPLGVRASRSTGYIEKQKMFSLRCFISFLLVLAQCEIYKIRESRRRLILGDPKEIVVRVRESITGGTKKLMSTTLE